MTSLKSREYVKETFNWNHYYWYLTDEGKLKQKKKKYIYNIIFILILTKPFICTMIFNYL